MFQQKGKKSNQFPSNNKYPDCPPRMSDGRHFTDYRPSTDTNNLIKMDNDIVNNYTYRNFLTNNADKIMERGVLLPVHHGMTDEMFDKLHSKVDMFLDKFI